MRLLILGFLGAATAFSFSSSHQPTTLFRPQRRLYFSPASPSEGHIGSPSSLHALSPDAFAHSFQLISDAVDAAAPAAAASTSNGWFGFLVTPIEGLLRLIHSGLEGVFPGQAWGPSIVLLTVFIKAVTYPLTYTQTESTTKMQSLQPQIKEVQAKYQSNPEVMNQKIAALYQDNEVNPLAGCLPSLVQIPVFIGLYRSVLNLAKENCLNESFLWLPNLEGPTYGADPAHGSDWILKGWVDGVPSLGYTETALFLTIPIFLVISQSYSQKLLQPPQTDPSQETSNAILKFLPLMIGWFSLNVPAALGVYWVANNIVTTAITLQVRSQFPALTTAPSTSSPSSSSTKDAEVVKMDSFPVREKPAGFGDSIRSDSGDSLMPLTADVVESDAPTSDKTAPDAAKPSGNPNKKKKKKGKK